jgi:hypothetical protein
MIAFASCETFLSPAKSDMQSDAEMDINRDLHDDA